MANVCKWKGFLRNTSIWSIFYVAGALLVIWSKIFFAPWIQCWSGSWDLKWLIIEWSNIGWAKSNYVHLFYSLNFMIWVCLKSRIAMKLCVNICISVHWFASRKLCIHTGWFLPNNIYNLKHDFKMTIDSEW